MWTALKNDQALPVGTTYTDGNGAQLVVPDPTAATAPSTSAPTQDSTTNPTTDPGSEETTTDNTEQSASVANNAANEEAAKQTAATCPPKDQ